MTDLLVAPYLRCYRWLDDMDVEIALGKNLCMPKQNRVRTQKSELQMSICSNSRLDEKRCAQKTRFLLLFFSVCASNACKCGECEPDCDNEYPAELLFKC